MIWVAVGGAIGALLLMVVALITVLAAARPTLRHANALLPEVLRAKFVRASGDLARIQAAVMLGESLVLQAQAAVDRIRRA